MKYFKIGDQTRNENEMHRKQTSIPKRNVVAAVPSSSLRFHRAILVIIIVAMIFVIVSVLYAHSSFMSKFASHRSVNNRKNKITREVSSVKRHQESNTDKFIKKKELSTLPPPFPEQREILEDDRIDRENIIASTQGIAHQRPAPSINFTKYCCFRSRNTKKTITSTTSINEYLLFRKNKKNKDHHHEKRFAILTISVLRKNFPLSKILAGYSFLNKYQFCQKHGYDFIFLVIDDDNERSDLLLPNKPPHWAKFRALQKYLPQYEWIWFLDLDTIIMEPEIPMIDRMIDGYLRRKEIDEKEQEKMKMKSSSSLNSASFHHEKKIDIIITHDWFPLNTGSFFIRNSDWSIEFLKKAAAVPREEARKYWKFEDHGAFLYLLGAQKPDLNNNQHPVDENENDENQNRNGENENLKIKDHFWILDNNFFNCWPPQFVKETDDRVYEYHDYDDVLRRSPFGGEIDKKNNDNDNCHQTKTNANKSTSKNKIAHNNVDDLGEFRDWVVHFMSFKSYKYSTEWFKWYFWRAQCKIMMNEDEANDEKEPRLVINGDENVEAQFDEVLRNKLWML